FFPWTIMRNDLYIVSFKTVNAADQGDYYSGMPVDKSSFDDLTKPWGDRTDPMIMQALNYAERGSFINSTNSLNMQVKGQSTMFTSEIEPNRQLDQHGNKDMFYFRKKAPFNINDSFRNP